MTDSAAAPDQTCRQCIHSRPAEGKLGETGWLQCVFERSHEYRSAEAHCAFDPVLWQQKVAKS